MKELAYMCVNCKKRVMQNEYEDVIGFMVMDVDGYCEPTCSIECAKDIKKRNIEKAQSVLDKVNNAEIEKMSL